MSPLLPCVLVALSCAGASAPSYEGVSGPDSGLIERITGTKPSVEKDGVVRVSWPRSDVLVRVDGQTIPPAAGLSSWAAFQSTERGAMLADDTVVFEDEVDVAMDAAFASSLAVTALHNHFFYDHPRVFFMHIEGHGDTEQLARAVRRVWDSIRAVRARRPQPAEWFGANVPTTGSINSESIETILGHPAPATGSILKMTVGREGTMHGVRIGGSMGLTTWAAFTGTDELASVAGDFIMTAGEVQPVLRALRAGGIHIVALHNHMVGDQPVYYFTHFWGRGPAANLARHSRRPRRASLHRKVSSKMSNWFWYAAAAAIFYGLHQIFTKIAAPHVSAAFGGFVVEITAAVTIGLYIVAERIRGSSASHATTKGLLYSVLTGICVGAGTILFFLLFQRGGPLSAVPAILAAGAALMALVGILAFAEPPSLQRLAGVALAI